jgi:diaminohydroxyphosphoribosylaminopyrimidine deaminase/5-amino-6-(5-phosphoribosylamino)uracil reductase
MIIPEDSRWMSRALTLAERGAGETNPNPMVGCVVIRDGHVIAEGHHRCAGGPHAEIVALESAGSRASGATLYVNLEPCAHHGRTPPCAPRIVAAGVRRVVVATRDPHPLVDGRGLTYLRQAGVGVDVGVLGSRATWLNRFFFVAQRYNRPYVLLKAAITIDARIATRNGDSKWITSGAQRNAARAMRRLFGGVLVGVGTVLRDDPVLLPRPSVHRPFWIRDFVRRSIVDSCARRDARP